jgi:hypothetical protein
MVRSITASIVVLILLVIFILNATEAARTRIGFLDYSNDDDN